MAILIPVGEIPILSILLLLPLIGSFIILTMVSRASHARIFALLITIVEFIFVLELFAEFNKLNTSYQFIESHEWIPSIGISYILGVDGLSLPMVLLTALITPMAIMFSWTKKQRSVEFFGLILVMELGIMGVFLALDFFLFFIFWEIVLIPMYFLIVIWGGTNRHYAGIKFFIYTHIASLIMLLSIFAMYFQAGPIDDGHRTFSMIIIGEASPGFPQTFQSVVFLALLLGFGIKLPMVPFHTWLPDAHVEAPTAGSVLLAALLLKMGGYGLIRIAVMMLPHGAVSFGTLMAILGSVSMVYAAFVCLAQEDLKVLIAYSSVSHMGFVLLGLSTIRAIGVDGAIFQMFNHGIITSVLFMMAGFFKHNAGTRAISQLRGMAPKIPIAAFVLGISFFASLGLPGLNSFVSEFMVFVDAYAAHKFWVLIPLLAIVVTGAYYVWTLHRILFGDYNLKLGKVKDLTAHEIIPLFILVALMIFFGVAPFIIVDVTHPISIAIVDILKGGFG
jgi:NADH-quinone oxidoreductase subunit M